VLQERFIANDLHLHTEQKLLLITGPNMGGKSTFMRQNALIVLLAHLGSFVPAERAQIGPIDQLFTRIGAGDDLAGGRSTFMVEMTETAHILRQATPDSLVLIDEIGRGTSTYDGMALAYACCTYLAQTIQAYTLFSTHYFELTSLPEECPMIRNVHLQARLQDSGIVFLYTVEEGHASQSYGLDVAALAGLPTEVLQLANHYLKQAEDTPTIKPLTHHQGTNTSAALLKELASINPDHLSAREALDLVYRLKTLDKTESSSLIEG
jgi:DNA mismatch repair protein MutS